MKLIEELKKKKNVENKANALIISNVVIYVLCRLPELVGVFFFYFHETILPSDGICRVDILCYLVYNTIEYIYIISYLFNILLYYKLNSNFRRGFQNLFGIGQVSRTK